MEGIVDFQLQTQVLINRMYPCNRSVRQVSQAFFPLRIEKPAQSLVGINRTGTAIAIAVVLKTPIRPVKVPEIKFSIKIEHHGAVAHNDVSHLIPRNLINRLGNNIRGIIIPLNRLFYQTQQRRIP